MIIKFRNDDDRHYDDDHYLRRGSNQYMETDRPHRNRRYGYSRYYSLGYISYFVRDHLREDARSLTDPKYYIEQQRYCYLSCYDIIILLHVLIKMIHINTFLYNSQSKTSS